MPVLGMLRTFASEVFGRRRQPRGPTPQALLGADGVLAAMEDGGEVDGRTAAGYLYHSAHISQVLVGRRHCVDLGCGNAMQLLQVASLNPSLRFTGVDFSAQMIARAEARAAALGLGNVDFIVGDLQEVLGRGRGPWDAAISTMLLHDLPDVAALERTLLAMAAAVGRDGALYIEDFARLKSPASIDFFVGLGAETTPDRFSALYRCSLAAAFTVQELRQAVTRCLPHARFHTTVPIPFLTVTKTAHGTLPADVRRQLAAMRHALPPARRADLDALRKSFALGGLDNDPFA